MSHYDMQRRRFTQCHADDDGYCDWKECPQLRDDEPATTGRHCPLDQEAPGEYTHKEIPPLPSCSTNYERVLLTRIEALEKAVQKEIDYQEVNYGEVAEYLLEVLPQDAPKYKGEDEPTN